MTDVPVPRGWSRGRRLAVACAVVVVVVAVAAGAVVLTTDQQPAAVLPDAASAFGDDGVLEPDLRWAAFSPSGRMVLVRTGAGIGIATGRDGSQGQGAGAAEGPVELVTPPGSRAVDAAWFPGETAILVAEGPISTGQLAVVELDGTVRGAIPISPSFAVGSGHGMAVSPDGRHAVVTATEREPVGGRRHLHLVYVDLERGEVTELTSADGSDESGPVYLSEGRILFTETSADDLAPSRAMVLDLDSGEVEAVSPAGADARAVGVVSGRPAYVHSVDIWTAGDGEPLMVAGGLDGDVLAVHPSGSLVITRQAGRAHLLRI